MRRSYEKAPTCNEYSRKWDLGRCLCSNLIGWCYDSAEGHMIIKIPFHSEGPIHQSGPYVGAARGSQLSCMFYWSYGIFLIWHIALHHPINFPTVTCHGSVYQFGFDVTLIIRFMPFGIRGLWILHRHQHYSTSTQLRLLIISGSV